MSNPPSPIERCYAADIDKDKVHTCYKEYTYVGAWPGLFLSCIATFQYVYLTLNQPSNVNQ